MNERINIKKNLNNYFKFINHLTILDSEKSFKIKLI